WGANPTRDYMANAAAGFDLVPEGTAVLDQGVPFDLIHPVLMAPYANARSVMTPQPGSPVFAGFAEEDMFGFASDGRVEKQDVDGPKSPTGPDANCGYRVTDAP